MICCPSCAASVEEASRFCMACGAALPSSVATVAISTGAESLQADPNSPAPLKNPSPQEGRFIPGTLLAGRYRLVALLGRGGMGEVYRADDTRLGQTVALKFLPDAVSRDPVVLERFYSEVRIGRQVSHPNVCRLYDLIEIEGHRCLSMEYVDGEDLSSLVSRIGRLPADKAVEIARDICAGLAAAHDKGVIHRDLKPANIMIDGKGRARIADFGIAALAEEIDDKDFAGTPAYLAPELLAGQAASIQSDIYALGLVLYEACTGKRLYDPRSLAELKAMLEKTEPPSLSSSARDIPVAMERIVMRCLEKNPDDRPASVHAVMAALPGGDPLQAAMAAGETPSPAMVAAAGKVGELAPGMAWALMLSALAALMMVAWLAGTTTLIGRVAPNKSPELLTEKAKDIIKQLGYLESPQDTKYSFDVDTQYLDYVKQHETASGRWDQIAKAQPGPLVFHYRQSPNELVALQTVLRGFGPSEAGRVTAEDPPVIEPGMINVKLDQHGRLLGLTVVPPAAMASAENFKTPNWNILLDAAGLPMSGLTPVGPSFSAPVDTDLKVAWTGHFARQPNILFRIEAASFQGRPVWFDVRGPWVHQESRVFPLPLQIAMWAVLLASLVMWTAIAVLVRRNLRLGRGDRKGAIRLTLFLLACTTIAQMLRADHVAAVFEEVSLVSNLMAQVMVYALINWLIYIALEPIARRRWPQLLVGWTRLLDGRWHDPLVGRDMLVGGLGGIALALVLHLAIEVPTWFGLPSAAPRVSIITSLENFRHLVHFILWMPYAAVTIGFGTLLSLLLNRAIFRSHLLALMVLSLSLYFAFALFTRIDDVWTVAGAAFTIIYLVIILRAGLLAAMISFYVFQVLEATPLSLNFSLWYADRTMASMILIVGLLLYGFWISLGRKPIFGSAWLERD